MGGTRVVVFLVGFVVYSLAAPSFNSRPVIKTEEGKEEIIVDSQTNVTVLCEGKERITWTYPNNTIEDVYWSTAIVESSESNGKFYAKLILTNASYVDVGYYYCHADDAPKDDEFRSTKIYVYIRDPVQLSVTPVDPVLFLNVYQYDTVVLPCIPTSPDVTVTLDTVKDSITNYTYTKHLGFKVKMNQFDKTFTCIFKRDGHSSELLIDVVVLRQTEYAPVPYIDAPNNGQTKLDDKYELNCSVNVEENVYFTLQWTVPDQAAVASGRINYTRTKSLQVNGHRQGFSTLTINKVQANDAGEYKCTITDHTKKKANATKKIYVYNNATK